MESDLRIDIITNGVIVSLVWWVGAYFAYWRRRWMLIVGLTIAGFSSVVFTAVSAGAEVPRWLIAVGSYMRLPVAVFVVGSFVWNQPRGNRPGSWLP